MSKAKAKKNLENHCPYKQLSSHCHKNSEHIIFYVLHFSLIMIDEVLLLKSVKINQVKYDLNFAIYLQGFKYFHQDSE